VTTRDETTGVILAAGKATRMWPFSTRYPKPILPVCNRPLLEYQIDEMKRVGIRDIIVVLGHLGFEIARVLNDGRHLGVRIRYVEQRETMGIAHAVGQLEAHVHGPFLLFLCDIFFLTTGLERMFALMDEGAHAVLAVRGEDNPDAIRRNFAVILDEHDVVRRVIEKPRHAPNRMKGCGLYLFDPYVFDAIRRTPRTAGRDEYEITDSIQILINDNLTVRAADVVEFDINVTYPADLLACNLKQLSLLGRDEMIGADCRLADGTTITASVVGNNVVVERPSEIANSVIFSDTHVRSSKRLDRMIVTADDVIDCRLTER